MSSDYPDEEIRRVINRGGKWYNNLPAPRPDNFDAMAAAWADPVAFAHEVAIYHGQLRDSGFDMRGIDDDVQIPPEIEIPPERRYKE